MKTVYFIEHKQNCKWVPKDYNFSNLTIDPLNALSFDNQLEAMLFMSDKNPLKHVLYNFKITEHQFI